MTAFLISPFNPIPVLVPPRTCIHLSAVRTAPTSINRHGNSGPLSQGFGSLFSRSGKMWSSPFTPADSSGWDSQNFNAGGTESGAGGTESGGNGASNWGLDNSNSFPFPSSTRLEYGRRRVNDDPLLTRDEYQSVLPVHIGTSHPPSSDYFSSLTHSSTSSFSTPSPLANSSSFVCNPQHWSQVRGRLPYSSNELIPSRTYASTALPAESSSAKPNSQTKLSASPVPPSQTHGSKAVVSRRTRKRQRPVVESSNDGPYSSLQNDVQGATGSSNGRRNMTSSKSTTPSKLRRQVRTIFERAREEERKGGIENARALYRQCLSLDRRDSHSWLALARLEARAGGLVLRHQPTEIAIEGSDDREFNGIRGAELARALFEEGLSECPESVHLLQAWAVLEHKCGNREKARELFAKGHSLEPENAYVCHAWGLLEQRVGNTETARNLFRRSISLRPHPEVCAAWAVLEAREGNVDLARELFEQGLGACRGNSSPSAATICKSWAEMAERVGDLRKARELLSKAIASQPRISEAYVALAKLEARRGGNNRALELMRAAASLSPKPPASVFNAWAQIEWTCCGRVEEARKLLEQGHRLHPSDPAILQSLGMLEDRCGNLEAAKKCFYASVCARPTAPAFVAWALLEEREGNFEEAKRLFEEALASDALHGAAYNAYGMMEARRGSLDGARAVYERGLKVYASASVWHGFGMLELKLGRNADRARDLFRQGVLQTREDTAFIWHSWGMLELSEKRVLEARGIFGAAMKRYPRNSRVLVGAALAASASDQQTRADDESARDLFRRAVGADPTHAHAWQAWGVFELRRGREDASQALFRRGLRLCPGHGALWQAWGVLETSRGNFARARQFFQRGVQACPLHVHLLQAWACMEVRSGNTDKARELLDHALEADPCHGPVWNAYGLLEARHGTIAKARQNFVTGIRRAPRHAPLYRAFGQTEVRVGNYDKARSLFKEGLRMDPRHAPLYHALAQLEAIFGNVAALGELQLQAEMYFGSEREAVRAMRSGEEGHRTDELEDCEGDMEYCYGAKATPMELALESASLPN